MIQFLTRKMVEKQIINEADREIYEYGLKVSMLYFLCFILAFIISILLNGFSICFFMILLFIPIRRFLGGFHLRNPYFCFICSELYILLPIVIVPFLLNHEQFTFRLLNTTFIFLLTFTVIVKSKLSAKRKHYTDDFRRKCTKKAVVYEITYFIIAYILKNTGLTFISCIITYILFTQFIFFLLPEQSYH